jgi:hypothetical protein
MRTLLSVLCLTAISLAACNNHKTMTVTSADGTKTTVDVTPAANYLEEMKKRGDELRKLTPMSTDELKAMLPEEMMGMKRTNFEAQSMLGYGVANATYKKDDGDQRVKVTIMDCAGEAGAGIYSMYLAGMSMVSESDNGYKKTVDFNGTKAFEEYNKNSEEYKLTFSGSDRLLVVVEGEKTGLDAVKDVAKNLKLK